MSTLSVLTWVYTTRSLPTNPWISFRDHISYSEACQNTILRVLSEPAAQDSEGEKSFGHKNKINTTQKKIKSSNKKFTFLEAKVRFLLVKAGGVKIFLKYF